MSEQDTEEVLFIEYHDGKPFSVTTTNSTYDVEWCKRDECLYFHESGGGGIDSWFPVTPQSVYWLRPDLKPSISIRREPYYRDATAQDDIGTRLAEPLPDYPLDLIISECGNDGECEYCPTCDDHLPTSDGYELCDHVFWCETTGWWSKPGERCPDDCTDCLEREHPTKGHEYPTGFIGTGHGNVGDDHWVAHSEYWDRRKVSGFYYREDWPWIAVGHGVGQACLARFEDDDDE